MDALFREYHFWTIGPVMSAGMSIFAVTTVYAKARHPRTPIGRYNSSDLCMFYQLWLHVIANVIFVAFSVPQIHEFLPCFARKWPILYVGVTLLLSQYPCVLDCAIRTNDTPFYEQFHSVSPYTHLLMIVLCTWVPLFATISLSAYFPQNELNSNICEFVADTETPSFFFLSLRSLFLLFVVWSYVYTIAIIIFRNKNIPNSTIKHFNRVLLVRMLVLLLLIAITLVSMRYSDPSLAVIEARFGLGCLFYTLGDVIAALLLPPWKPSIISILTPFKPMTGA